MLTITLAEFPGMAARKRCARQLRMEQNVGWSWRRAEQRVRARHKDWVWWTTLLRRLRRAVAPAGPSSDSALVLGYDDWT